MAYIKKKDRIAMEQAALGAEGAVDSDETATGEVVEETEQVGPEKSTMKEKVSAKDEEISALKEQIAQMQAMIASMAVNMSAQAQPQQVVVTPTATSSLNDDVTIVHLVERAAGLTSHIELSTGSIDMSKLGEERTLDRRQAEELIGKYRRWFDTGIIALGAGHEDFAKKYQLRTINQYTYMNSDLLDRLPYLSASDLENLYEKLCDGHKEFIIGYFKRKAIDAKDPKFRDMKKLNTLNVASGGELESTINEIRRQTED